MATIPQSIQQKQQAAAARVQTVRSEYAFIYIRTEWSNGYEVDVWTCHSPRLLNQPYTVRIVHDRAWRPLECSCPAYVRQCKHQLALCDMLNERPN